MGVLFPVAEEELRSLLIPAMAKGLDPVPESFLSVDDSSKWDSPPDGLESGVVSPELLTKSYDESVDGEPMNRGMIASE